MATVLIVDDDVELRLALRQVLVDEGFDVREASDGLEALESIGKEEPDLVILDLMMPVMSGWNVLDMLRNARKGLPVIVLSALPPEGSADHLEKPITRGQMLNLLEVIRTRVKERCGKGE